MGYVVLLAAVFDLFDGFLARKLGVSGPFGRELDSLADMVTFGSSRERSSFNSCKPPTLPSWLSLILTSVV